MHSTILACASDDFQKSFENSKNVLFQKCVQIYHKQKRKYFMFFKSARPDCNHMHFKSIKNALKIFFLSITVDICIFNQKNYAVKNSCPKTLLNFYPLKCTYLGKSSFQFYQLLVRKIEFEKLPIRSWRQCTCVLRERSGTDKNV